MDVGKPNVETKKIATRDESTVELAAKGCLVSAFIITGITSSFLFVLPKGLEFLTIDNRSVIGCLVWLLVLPVGGYISAGPTPSRRWMNSLWVGIFAAALQMWGISQGDEFHDGLTSFLESPAESWPQLLALVLTIPAALLGGWMAKRRHP